MGEGAANRPCSSAATIGRTPFIRCVSFSRAAASAGTPGTARGLVGSTGVTMVHQRRPDPGQLPGISRSAERQAWRGRWKLRRGRRYARRTVLAVDSHPSALSGLFVPVDGATSNGYRTGAGIIVPDRAMAAAQLGLTPAPANSAWFENFVKAYLTATDYLGATSSRLGVPFDPAWFAKALLYQHPREVYLQVLAALNHAVRDPQVAEIYQERFLSRINPAMAALIRQALRGEIDG